MLLLTHNILPGDSAWNHLLSSFCAGLCACLASSPVDVIRTRLMDQRRLLRKKAKKEALIYKSSWECGLSTVRSEGFLALYKGFVPSFTRMGPWNIIFFLVYEHLKRSGREWAFFFFFILNTTKPYRLEKWKMGTVVSWNKDLFRKKMTTLVRLQFFRHFSCFDPQCEPGPKSFLTSKKVQPKVENRNKYFCKMLIGHLTLWIVNTT